MQLDPIVWRLHETVARQHHLFVELLPEPLRTYSALSYLIFRIIDSVEDAAMVPEKQKRLLGSLAAKESGALDAAAKAVAQARDLPDAYRELALNWTAVRTAVESTPEKVRVLVRNTGAVMAGEMLRFLEQWEATPESMRPYFLRNFDELGDYCFGVAGCVGTLNLDLFVQSDILTRSRAGKLKGGATELGRYLQLVNVVRDNADDRRERQKTYFPISIRDLPEEEQVARILDHAAEKENAIAKYLAGVADTSVSEYSLTLFRVAQIHLQHYRKHPEVFHRKTSPGAIRLLTAMPLKLQKKFIGYKLRKSFSGNSRGAR